MDFIMSIEWKCAHTAHSKVVVCRKILEEK